MTAVDPTAPVRRRVVIAEDEALIRMDLAEMLAEEGYDVVGQAGDGARAVELAERAAPRPGDPGREDARPRRHRRRRADRRRHASRRSSCSPPSRQRDLVERAREAGAMAYLVKPFGKHDLVPAIEMAVSRYAELTALEREVTDLTDRLETRKAVDRAKAELQTQPGPERVRGVPLDPEDGDGPAAQHAPGRRGRHHPRSRPRGLTSPNLSRAGDPSARGAK